MAHARKIAITVDGELLKDAERMARSTCESRSALLARALRQFLRTEEHRRKIERYLQAYREHPETPQEVATMDKLANEALSAVPWETA